MSAQGKGAGQEYGRPAGQPVPALTGPAAPGRLNARSCSWREMSSVGVRSFIQSSASGTAKPPSDCGPSSFLRGRTGYRHRLRGAGPGQECGAEGQHLLRDQSAPRWLSTSRNPLPPAASTEQRQGPRAGAAARVGGRGGSGVRRQNLFSRDLLARRAVPLPGYQPGRALGPAEGGVLAPGAAARRTEPAPSLRAGGGAAVRQSAASTPRAATTDAEQTARVGAAGWREAPRARGAALHGRARPRLGRSPR